MRRKLEVAIVGAGPYGLSVAAHTEAAGCSTRIFGKPMSSWDSAMPAGMMLKSDGFASSLSAPDGRGTLAEFCTARGIPYADKGLPIALETFVAYGHDFQRRYVPFLDPRQVIALDRAHEGFRLTLEGGEQVRADRVVLAVGITHFRQLPDILGVLPHPFVSHSADHHCFDRFEGKKVAIIGGGASAIDVAVALREAGASPALITRRDAIKFYSQPQPGLPSLWRRLRHPPSPLGPGWRSRIASTYPWLFRYLPARLRLYVVRRHLGPASAFHMREKVVGKIEIVPGAQIAGASVRDGRAVLTLAGNNGGPGEITVDHVIAATGYWPSVGRIAFLSPELRASMDHASGVPLLSRHFESSVHGLYVTGLATTGSFGPLMRFVAGADFTARRISSHLARQSPMRRSSHDLAKAT
jgi:cation diffusion facilitator CzcD-associated flavoprotein CzcO